MRSIVYIYIYYICFYSLQFVHYLDDAHLEKDTVFITKHSLTAALDEYTALNVE